ncbi:recombinase family protein [Pseudoclavibacter sp. CFCC 11306]|uniref:recombinase family protein n=1 Tax=Pseudoclavibacter sp. CFCC 11306 TaxID=1564493 RepID=UPI00130170A6|nr:recombinase family protein [Pseudoclavibacter sp. CFCC 11306]KAB1658175.1 recombinase family protein [Pseudoclavibacter sp. CFCC 11306]
MTHLEHSDAHPECSSVHPQSGGQPVENPVGPAQKGLDSLPERRVNGDMAYVTSPRAQGSPEVGMDPMSAIAQAFAPKRAVTYLRVSTKEQATRGGRDEGFSIPAQRDANKKKAQSLGAFIVKEFIDPGESGTSINRPGLKEMIAYLKEEGDTIDYLVVHKVDRLARNRADDVYINSILDELNIRLVSTSENIDQSPSGLLVHGIMSSIAEFYSKNLSNEVKKGMAQKVRGGGAVGRAPIGYLNAREVVNGQENRAVVLDPERSSLIHWCFEAYATGNWTLAGMAEELTARGLRTVATARVPSKPISPQYLHKVLINEFYMGKVKYRGALYNGQHTPLVKPEVFDQVQVILKLHANGERTRVHPHYLKSQVFCGICGERLIVTHATSRSGDVYPYFLCAGRHAKRSRTCNFRATLIDQVEEEICKVFDQITISAEARARYEQLADEQFLKLKSSQQQELDDYTRTREAIERKRHKLLEAHYADAISIDILRQEQTKLDHELQQVDRRIGALQQDLAEQQRTVHQALDFAQYCGAAYRAADEQMKRLLIQLFFDRLYIFPEDNDQPLTVIGHFEKPLDWVYASPVTSRARHLPEQGSAATPDNEKGELTGKSGQLACSVTTTASVLHVEGLNTAYLVGLTGFEPATP